MFYFVFLLNENITRHRAGKTDFVLELLQNFDFVRVEEVSEELTDAHKVILNERWADYIANPDSALDWKGVKNELSAKYEKTPKREWSGGLSDETADKMLAYVEKSRQEWEERISNSFRQ